MTKPARSPILGYNHNIQFHGHVFHVQTEDSGAQHARLFTHLFVGGTILASKKEQYDATAPEDAVRLLMQRLHKAMIKELKDGVHDPSIQGFFAARGEHIQLGDRPSLVQVPAVGPLAAAGAHVAAPRPRPPPPPRDPPPPPPRRPPGARPRRPRRARPSPPSGAPTPRRPPASSRAGGGASSPSAASSSPGEGAPPPSGGRSRAPRRCRGPPFRTSCATAVIRCR